MFSRRAILKFAGSALFVSGLSPLLVACNSSSSDSQDVSPQLGGSDPELRKSHYESLKSTWFHMHNPQSPLVDMELMEVLEGPEDDVAEQFTLVFNCSAGSAIEEGLYQVEHSEVGSLQLYLMPSEHQGGCYTASFSLI